ncbi:hypothetical protein Tco_1389681 [Tanacetum coccineum]
MAALPRCDELCQAAHSSEWEDMFILDCHRAIVEDIRLAREINGLCDGLTAVIEERELFIGISCDIVQSSFFFLADDDNSERSERFVEEAFGSVVVPALVSCSFTRYVSDFLAGMVDTIVRVTSSMRSCDGVPAKAIVVVLRCSMHHQHKKKSMAALPKCEELQMTVNSSDWSVMFIHHYRREISKDLRLSQKINALCARLTDIVVERERFIDELDRLVRRAVPERMAEFMKEVQNKDMPNRLKLQILSREFELRAREKDIFIEKLKGNMDF